MTENGEIISRLLRTKQPPTLQWVQDMLAMHPAYIIPALLLLKRNPQSLDPHSLEKLQSTVMLNCADRTALTDYIDPTGDGWATFYPEEEVRQSTTEETIDDFLQTFGHASTPEEDALLERLIFNPVPPDYFADTDEPFDPSDPLALPPELMPKDDDEPQEYENPVEEEKTQKNGEHIPEQAQSNPDESLLMESLAKIFIKQHRYERAFEIISKLSLNYPEKSVYFADQLRFLRKLMINQQYQSK